MALDSDTLAAIQEIVTAAIKPISDQLEKTVYDNSKLNQSIAHISEDLNQKITALNPMSEYVQNLKNQEEEKKVEQPKEQSKLDKAVAKVREEYEARFAQLQQQLEARDIETQKLKEADRQNRMRTDALSEMRSLGTIRANTEEDLLTLLEKRGLVVEKDDKLFIKTQGKYGEILNTPFAEILPKMLENDFAHFSTPRSGSGTDGQKSSRAPQTNTYRFEEMSAQEIYNRYRNDPEAMRAYDQLLEESFTK
jgi:uncharacterized protein YoxC